MPNYVKVQVIGKDMEALKNALCNDKDYVDFNKVIPMPEDLNISSGSMSYKPMEKRKHDLERYKGDSEHLKKATEDYIALEKVEVVLERSYSDDITCNNFVYKVMESEEVIETLNRITQDEALTYIKGFFNLKRYGYEDWYEWRMANWGTKWNACESYWDDKTGANFETAWAMPALVLEKLAEVTPIRVLYSDEDLGYNCGIVDFYMQDGELCKDEIEVSDDVELAYYAHGYEYIPAYDDDYEELPYNSEEVKEKNKTYANTVKEIEQLMDLETFKKDMEVVNA